MQALIKSERHALITHLERSHDFDLAILYAVRSLRHSLAEYPTWDRLEEFFRMTPSMSSSQSDMMKEVLRALRRLGRLDYPHAFYTLWHKVKDTINDNARPQDVWGLLADLRGIISDKKTLENLNGLEHLGRNGELEPLWDYLNSTKLASKLLVKDESDEYAGSERQALVLNDENQFVLTRLGAIACANGVDIHTCYMFYDWLLAQKGKMEPWDVLDLLALVRDTPDGRSLAVLRSALKSRRAKEIWEDYLSLAESIFGPAWRERSPLIAAEIKNTRLQVTLLALADWYRGAELNNPDLPEDIENTYKLLGHGSNLYRHARGHARLLRVLSNVAASLPEESFPSERPEGKGIFVPYDLDSLATSMLHGLPDNIAEIASLGIQGLSRTWILSLSKAVDDHLPDRSLTPLERLKTFAEDDDFPLALPTPGLAARIRKSLDEKPRSALAELLRGEENLILSYYQNGQVIKAQLLQGKDRFTALQVLHRGIYTVFRRNVVRGTPIELTTEEDLIRWVKRGAVEFLAEIGVPTTDGYKCDRFLIDLDPQNDYPLARLKLLAADIKEHLGLHRWVDRVYCHWSGGTGFHIVGHFTDDMLRSAETVLLESKRIVRHYLDDVQFFFEKQPWVIEPYVILDLTPVKGRGVYRNVFSINAATGDICVPVHLDTFLPEYHAKRSHVLSCLERMAGDYVSFDTFIQDYLSLQL
jgi:hypothetical protein